MGAEITVVQGITLAVAILGAVLGIINTWHGLDKSRVKLVVKPKQVIPFGGADPRLTFCIDVTNLSAFPVTVHDVGVFFKNSDKRGAISPVLMDGGVWPRRLESRSSVTVFSQKPVSSNGLIIKCAYARTECGVTQRGNSPALKQIASESV